MSDPTAPASLLRTEAEERAGLLEVTTTAVQLDLTGAGDTFTSVSTVTFDAVPGCSTFVDFKGEALERVVLNGTELPTSSWTGGRIALPDLAEHNTVVVAGRMAYSSDGEGLHRHVDPADQQTYLYAMSFLDAAPRWFACFDQPDLQSLYSFTVAAPADWTVVGNGPAEQLGPGRWRIVAPCPMSTYYVTLVAGPYTSVLDEHDGIPLGLHVRTSLGEALRAEAADLLAVTKAAFDYYHRVFGVRYPFGEYHQAFVPDFNAGAMENPGCVTFRDQYIYRSRATRAERAHRAGTVAHEMAHMWFGDLVTMRWWDDLWLNESFAEYMAHRACAAATSYPLWTEFGIVRKDWGAVADQGPSTHPVAGNGSLDAGSALQDFDGISYAKGASVLQQLVAYLGDDVFFGGLGRYFAEHAYGNASFADLMAAWTAAGATDLEEWADRWLRTAGMDTLDVVGGSSVLVASTAPDGGPGTRTHAVQVGAVAEDGSVPRRTAITLAGTPVSVEVPPETRLLVPDAGDATWARIRFGPGSWPVVAELLPRVSDPAVRVVLCNSVRDAVRGTELDPAEALALLLDGMATEPSDVVLDTVLGYALEQLAGLYAAPPDRPLRRRRVYEAATTALAAAAAGCDRQLLCFRLAVRSSDDTGLLDAWRAGSRLPAGLLLDPELTWALVERLSLLTGDSELVERTLAADPSSAAAVHAARARAGLPTEQAKEQAWRMLAEPSAASAYELYAVAEGFFSAEQDALTAPYVERYFTDLPATARFRTGWVLGQVAKLVYPLPHSTPESLARAEQVLATPDLAAPVRRSLQDETDRLRRAVRSRQRFG